MKIANCRIFIVVLTLFVMPTLSFGKSYYMRSDGTADNKNNALSCSSASHAMDEDLHNQETFSSGDMIILCDSGGSYSTGLNTPSAGVVYTVAKDHHVVFEGSYSGKAFTIGQNNISLQRGNGKVFEIKRWGSTNSSAIVVNGNNATIDGLTIHDSDNGGINVDGAAYTVIKNCTLYDSGDDTADEFIAFAGSSHDWTVQYCEIYGNKNRGIDGIVITGRTYNGTVEYCYIHDFYYSDGEGSEQAIDIKTGAHNIVIRYNYFKNIRDSHGMIVHSQYDDIYGIQIISNRFEKASESGLAIYARGGHDIYDIDIVGNLFIGNDKSGLSLSSEKPGDNWYQVRIYNNTFINNSNKKKSYPIMINGASTEHGTKNTGSDEISNFIKNNIFNENASASSRDIMYDSDGTAKYVIMEYNQFFDSNGTARCRYDASWYDCDSKIIGLNNEISQTNFLNSSNFVETTKNITPAQNLGEKYKIGLAENTNWKGVTDGKVYSANRDNFNQGTWGKGAGVYGSLSINIEPPPHNSIQNPPSNLRIKTK